MTAVSNALDLRRSVRRGASTLLRSGGYAVIAVGLLLLVWWLLSLKLRPWLPAPDATYQAAVAALGSAEFYSDMLITLRRVLIAFVVAGVFGSVLGVLVGLSRRVEAVVLPILAVALAIPDPVYIIFAILALGAGEGASVVALLLAISPFVTNIVRASVDDRDVRLDQMVAVYGVSRARFLRDVLLPQLVPAFKAAARTAFALSWKIVVVVEALSRPEGVGAAIYQSFRVLRMREMLALAILFTVLMELIERVGLGWLQRRQQPWRTGQPDLAEAELEMVR